MGKKSHENSSWKLVFECDICEKCFKAMWYLWKNVYEEIYIEKNKIHCDIHISWLPFKSDCLLTDAFYENCQITDAFCMNCQITDCQK